MSYCNRDDLAARLSETGLLFVADDNADEITSESELVSSVDQAIAAATTEIDQALTPHVQLPVPSGNQWLKHRAIDLAAEHLAERKGNVVPASLSAAADRSRTWLNQVRQGQLRVPHLVYPSDSLQTGVRQLGLPRLVNPNAASKS